MNLNVDKAVLIKSECADQSVSYMVGDWMRWLELDCVTLLRLKFHANSIKSGFRPNWLVLSFMNIIDLEAFSFQRTLKKE